MLSYELCQRLKDKGFPSKQWEGHYWYSNYNGDWQVIDGTKGTIKDDVCCPALEDLILELGKRIVLWEHEGKFYAGKTHGNYAVSNMYVDDYPHPCEEGDSPEEALANLYLALHPDRTVAKM